MVTEDFDLVDENGVTRSNLKIDEKMIKDGWIDRGMNRGTKRDEEGWQMIFRAC